MKATTKLRELLHDRFGIDHVTLQIEPSDFEEREIRDCGTK